MSNQKSYPGDMTDAQAELLLSFPQQNQEVVEEQQIYEWLSTQYFMFCVQAVLEHGFLMITPQKEQFMIIFKNGQKMERG